MSVKNRKLVINLTFLPKKYVCLKKKKNYAYVHGYIIHKIEYMGSCGKWKIKYNTSIMVESTKEEDMAKAKGDKLGI